MTLLILKPPSTKRALLFCLLDLAAGCKHVHPSGHGTNWKNKSGKLNSHETLTAILVNTIRANGARVKYPLIKATALKFLSTDIH